MKVKKKLYYQTTTISFWAIIILISLLPIGLSRLGIELYITPQIEVAITFFISTYFITKSWHFFLYGLLIDVVYGNPIGLTSFILLLLNYIIKKFKSNLARQNIGTILLYFFYSTVATIFIKHITLSIYYGSSIIPYYSEILINILINIIFYPILHLLLSKTKYLSHENQQ